MSKFGPNSNLYSNSRPDINNSFPGVYRARVEFNRDPLQIGRVKVRVPQMHGVGDEAKGSDTVLKTSELPWASPGSLNGAGYDMGQFLIPMVGSTVFVAFEEGDPEKPVYFGGVPGTGGKAKKMNHIGDIPKDSSHADYFSGPWSSGVEGDAPKDVYAGRKETQDITRGVIFKSAKGHTIMYDDTDGKESFTILDRVGQIIKLDCPVSPANNKGNANKRGTKSAENNTQYADTAAEPYILIKSSNTKNYNGITSIKLRPSGVDITSEDKSGNKSTYKQSPSKIEINAKQVVIKGDRVDIN